MEALFALHSMFRWLVLLAGLAALAISLIGWLGRGGSDQQGRLSMLIFAILIDIQAFIGILLYFNGQWFASNIRQIKFEHPIVMLLALVVAHVVASRARRSPNQIVAARTRAIGAAISLVLILAGIPWVRA
jgi:heme A synthase